MSKIYSIADEHPDWTELASIDESAPYEVDITEIWRSGDGKFQLVTASGCSCWSGEYESEPFDDLDALEASVLAVDRRYNPSLVAAAGLVATARAAL